MIEGLIICGPESGTDGKRPVHAYYRTRGLPRGWEEADDGRWMHVDHGDKFAEVVEQVTCKACLYHIAKDKEVTT